MLQAARDFLDHLVARIGDRIDRMAEADHDFLGRDPAADIGLGFVRVAVALLHFERDLVGAAMLRPAQRADRAGDRRIEVRAGAGDRARGEGRGVVFVLGIEDQRGMHRALVRWRRLPAMQQMQEVRADRIVVGFDVDAAAVVRVMVPVEQHRSERGHQPVGDVARAGLIVIMGFRAACSRARRRRFASHPSDARRRAAVPASAAPRAASPRSAFSLAL